MHCIGNQIRQRRRMTEDPEDDESPMSQQEADEDRHQNDEHLLDAAKIGDGESDDDGDLGRDLPGLPDQRQKAEQGIDAAGHRQGRGQDEIDDERRTGDEPGIGAHEDRGDAIAAAARGKQFDDLDIAQTDDDDGERRGQRQIHRQVIVAAQRQEGFFRAVVGGRQAVGAQADPGEECNQQHALALAAMQRVAGRAEDPTLDLLPVVARHAVASWAYFRRRNSRPILTSGLPSYSTISAVA